MDPYSDIPTAESDMDRRPKPEFPIGAILWVPLAIMFAGGMVLAAKIGYDRATTELEQRPNPASENESNSSAFLVDPGEEPLVFASKQKPLRDHLLSPPGSINSETVLIDKPVRLRLLRRDQDLAYVIVVEGRYQGMSFWTKKDRVLEARPETDDDAEAPEETSEETETESSDSDKAEPAGTDS